MPHRVRLIGCLIIGSLLTGPTKPAKAQSGPDRAYLDSLILSIDQSSSGGLPPRTQCRPTPASLGRLCDGWLLARQSELQPDKKIIEEGLRLLERVADEEPAWALAWYGLGRVRLAADKARMNWRKGPLQTEGMDYAQGAAAAFERALALDSTLAGAARALAVTPFAFTDAKELATRTALLRRYRALLAPDQWVAAAGYELDAGQADSAITLLRSALRSGAPDVPRGQAQLILARALYRVGRPKDGRVALLAGASATDSAGLADYREQLSWIGDSTEMKAWETLTPAERPAWLSAFWARRDVNDGRADGERLTEHFRRVNYAYDHYRMVLPSSGQQKALLEPNEGAFRRWLVRTIDSANRPARGTADRSTGQAFQDLMGTIQDYIVAREMLGSQSPFRVFESRQSVLDDRGLIYVRHGAPTQTARATPGRVKVLSSEHEIATGVIEVWRYERPTQSSPLILYFVNRPFQGSPEPNVLIPTALAEDPETRFQLCVLDPAICPFTNDLYTEIRTHQMSSDKVGASRLEGLKQIKEAVTTDEFAREFAKPLHPSLQLHALDLARGGEPRLVMAFAIPGQEIHPNAAIPNAPVVYPIQFNIMAVRRSDGRRIDLDSTRHFSAPRTLEKGSFLSGVMELPLPPGEWSASVLITQPDGRGSLTRTLGELVMPAATPKLSAGDLVLGLEEVGVLWKSGPGGRSVPFNPLNAFPTGSTASLYTQIDGLQQGTDYKVTVELFAGSEAKGNPALRIAFDEHPVATRIEFTRTLGLTALEAGQYLVRLTISGNGASAVTTGGLRVVK